MGTSFKVAGKRYHFVGVGGVGMSALAGALIDLGACVTGSDRAFDAGERVPALETLARHGLRLFPQNGDGVSGDVAAVVVSSAIEKGNPDITAAETRGIPVLHRTELLAALVSEGVCVAVSGTAGKTTATGMVAWILERAGLAPWMVNGGQLLNWMSEESVGNYRRGASELWVLELDESDKSLLRFRPDWALITNMSKDHFELTEVQSVFKAFAAQAKKGVVGCFGSPSDEELRWLLRVRSEFGRVSFEYGGASFVLQVLGEHNAENALQAAALCGKLGVSADVAARALRDFRGIHRRLEIVGAGRGVTVIDDYAHNPAKLSAAWRAVAPHFRRVLAVWRPHGYGPLALMRRDLAATVAAMMRPQDRFFVLPVYYAGGTASRIVDSGVLVEDLRALGAAAKAVEDYSDLGSRLLAEAGAGDAILVMGARDLRLPVFARELVSELGGG